MPDKEYHRQKSKEHYQKYKEKYNKRNQEQKAAHKRYMLDIKKAGCAVCDESDPNCLDFHHLGGKDQLISQMRAFNKEKLNQEISKCILLCANCHRKVHLSGLILTEDQLKPIQIFAQ